ncbi:NADH-quinone oxidoreductase subunit C [Desulfocurvibacter africanus]|uniref:NADH-quinone oxidoreductase subunit C n=1 Tax=Desulfocurvibacter africanus TaxID=873 RepID=UPI002FDA3FE9
MSENVSEARPVGRIENIRVVAPAEIRAEAEKRKQAGWRLVTLSCTELDAETLDIIYHFDQDLRLEHLRVNYPKATPLPSISGVYFAALLVENEIQDHFGVSFEGLVVDYGKTLLLDQEVQRTPFCKYNVATKVEK